jgi:hypothetical protein
MAAVPEITERQIENLMKEKYEVRLIDKGEVIEYRDDIDVYHFSAWRKNKKWTVYLPGTNGKYYQPHELTEDEQKVIFPRIRTHLEGIRYFIWFGPSYPVIFEREGPISPEMKALRLAIPQYLAKRDKSN